MGIKNLGKDKSMRVKTPAGLNISLFNECVEIELSRMPFGLELKLVDTKDVDGVIAPLGAYYIIQFYKPVTVTGESGRINEAKASLPGTIYLSKEGVLIRGCTPVPSKTNESSINYKDRF
jgi:hypothetical protein